MRTSGIRTSRDRTSGGPPVLSCTVEEIHVCKIYKNHKLTPIQKQLDTLLAVVEDPGKNTSSREQGPKKFL